MVRLCGALPLQLGGSKASCNFLAAPTFVAPLPQNSFHGLGFLASPVLTPDGGQDSQSMSAGATQVFGGSEQGECVPGVGGGHALLAEGRALCGLRRAFSGRGRVAPGRRAAARWRPA